MTALDINAAEVEELELIGQSQPPDKKDLIAQLRGTIAAHAGYFRDSKYDFSLNPSDAGLRAAIEDFKETSEKDPDTQDFVDVIRILVRASYFDSKQAR